MKKWKWSSSVCGLLKRDIWRLKLPICILAIWFLINYVLWGSICPFRCLTGYPCPGCGLTRGCLLILCLRFDDAAGYNAASFLWMGFLFCFAVRRYLLFRDTAALRRFLPLICLITLAYYAYRIACCFPGEEPMRVQERNLAAFLLERMSQVKG